MADIPFEFVGKIASTDARAETLFRLSQYILKEEKLNAVTADRRSAYGDIKGSSTTTRHLCC